MIRYLSLLISSALLLNAANPPFNPGQNPSVLGLLGSTTNMFFTTNMGGIQYGSPAAGNNGNTDILTNNALFKGVIGITHDPVSIGGSVYLWSSVGTGTNSWGAPMIIPGGVSQIGLPYPADVTNRFVDKLTINFMGNQFEATRSNLLISGSWKDVGMHLQNWNPYSNPYFGVGPVTTVNSNYNIFGAGTFNSMIGTNAEGNRLFYYTTFGPVFGMSAPGWLANATGGDGNHTNASGEGWIILGGSGETWGFSVSENSAYGGQFLQYPLSTWTRTWNTNTPTGELGFRIPKRTGGVTVVTNVGWRDTAYFDIITGNVTFTNGLTTVSNILSKSTNNGANIFGGAYDGSVVNSFNGSSSFNVENTPYGNYGAYTFDAASAHRVGFQVQSGFYPKLVFGSGAPFQIAQSSVSDLQTSQTTALLSNLLVFDNRHGYTSNLTDFTFNNLLQINSGNGRFTISNNVATTNTSFITGGNAPSMTFGPGGNVGINTAPTANALTISGTVSASSFTSGGNGTFGALIINGGGSTVIQSAGVNTNTFGTTAGNGTIVASNFVANGSVAISGGIASFATNSTLTVGTTGITNTLGVNIVVYEFAGVSVTHTKQNGNTFSRGTISAGIDIVLKPGESLTGTSCSAATNAMAW